MKKTQHLVQRAAAGVEGNAAFWLGSTLASGLIKPAVGLVSIKDCITQVEGDFGGIFKKTGVCGVDGSG